MSYVDGFAHDIFVSYSTVDNEILVKDGEQKRGWVDIVLDKLGPELKSRLGGRDCNILVDHEFIRSNIPLTPQILDAVRGSATLLVVMSPSYLKSVWCNRERGAFLDVVKERVAAGAMLVLRARPVAPDDQPAEFRDLHGVEFFTSVEGAAGHRVLGYPDPNERPFTDRIIALSGEIDEQLKKSRHELRRSPAAPRAGKTVFVASATDDLEEREMELRSYLVQAGLDVLPSPQSRYPTTDLAAHQAAVLRELEGCCLFAQLLSPVQGKELFFAPGKRAPALQYEIACRAKKPVLQWRARDQAIDVKDSEHRALLEGARACGIEEFKRMVVEEALRPPPPPPPPRSPRVAIFVNADARDRPLADEISAALTEFGVDCYGMPETGSPEEIRVALEKNACGCNGIVLVYGKTEFYWVQEQLRQVRKMTEGQLSTMAVFEGPPSEKPKIPVTIKDLEVLPCREGLDPEKLRGFADRLRKRG